MFDYIECFYTKRRLYSYLRYKARRTLKLKVIFLMCVHFYGTRLKNLMRLLNEILKFFIKQSLGFWSCHLRNWRYVALLLFEPIFTIGSFLILIIIGCLWGDYVKRHDITTPDCSIADRHSFSELPTTFAMG